MKSKKVIIYGIILFLCFISITTYLNRYNITGWLLSNAVDKFHKQIYENISSANLQEVLKECDYLLKSDFSRDEPLSRNDVKNDSELINIQKLSPEFVYVYDTSVRIVFSGGFNPTWIEAYGGGPTEGDSLLIENLYFCRR